MKLGTRLIPSQTDAYIFLGCEIQAERSNMIRIFTRGVEEWGGDAFICRIEVGG